MGWMRSVRGAAPRRAASSTRMHPRTGGKCFIMVLGFHCSKSGTLRSHSAATVNQSQTFSVLFFADVYFTVLYLFVYCFVLFSSFFLTD